MSETKQPPSKLKNIRNVYLYLVSLVGIVLVMIGAIMLINTGIDYWILGPENASSDFRWKVQECGNTKWIPTPDGQTGSSAEKTDEEIEKCIETTKKLAKEAGIVEIKQDISWSVAMLIVALPVWMYHWRTVQKDHNSGKKA